jgi:uncharacterized membrane protein YvlD (DUF360 family)
LFTLVINAWLVILTDYLISGLFIPSFSLSFATAFIIFVLIMISDRLLHE